MNSKIKFIHTADIHLGRPLSYGGSPPERIKDLFNQAGEKAFIRLRKMAVDDEVDFIIIAGDLYDREARSVKSSRFFLEECRKLEEAGIKLYIISGNHDPASSEREVFELPENVKVFSSENVETEIFKRAGKNLARIMGQSYREKFEERSMYSFYTADDRRLFNIAIIHTALDKQNRRYVPLSKSDLLSKNEIHYWALGHIHQKDEINNSDPVINYPGTIQGRDINESGEKGCLLVEVDDYFNVKSDFITLSPVIFKTIEIDLNDKEVENISELEKLIFARAEVMIDQLEKNDILEGAVVRWIIGGRTAVNKYVESDRNELIDNLLNELRKKLSQRKAFIWSHSLVFRTSDQLPELEELREKNQLYSEIGDLIDDILNDKELEEEMLEEWGEIWQGSSDAEDREAEKFSADKELKKEILSEAEKVIITELLKGGD